MKHPQPQYTFFFGFYLLAPPLWRCLVVYPGFQCMLALSEGHSHQKLVLLLHIISSFFWQSEGSCLIWDWGSSTQKQNHFLNSKLLPNLSLLLLEWVFLPENSEFDIYIYLSTLLCLLSPSFCVTVIPSERMRKGSLIVTKKLLRIISKGTKQFTHKMFIVSSITVTI